MVNVRCEYIIEHILITKLEHITPVLGWPEFIHIKSLLGDFLPVFGDLRVEKNHVLWENVVWHLDSALKPLKIQRNTDTIGVVGCELYSWAERSEVFGHNSFWYTCNRKALLNSTVVQQGKVAVLNDQLLGVGKDHGRV